MVASLPCIAQNNSLNVEQEQRFQARLQWHARLNSEVLMLFTTRAL